MPNDPPSLVGRLVADQWTRWLSGERISAEEILSAHPELAVNVESAVELIYAEFTVREELGEVPLPGEYLSRFPSLTGPLTRQFEVHALLGSIDGEAGGSCSEGPSEPPEPLFVASERFTILRRLGAGRMGIVFEAIDARWRDHVALKTLHGRDAGAIERLKREFRSLADVSHPNLAALYELFQEGDRAFFTMELVDGCSLFEYVRPASVPPGSLKCGHALERLRQSLLELAEGLAHLHESGRIHRDIKPANVRVTSDGRLVVLDFGLAALLDSPSGVIATGRGYLAGTWAYMAPECWAGAPLTPAADWFSVGVLLHELLLGRRPTFIESREGIAIADFPTELSDPWYPLVEGLLARDPGRRFGRAQIRRHLGAAPAPRVSQPRRTLVGRESEFETLRAFVARATATGGVLRLLGGSGLGKSTLADALAASILRENGVVLRGQSSWREVVPFQAVEGALKGLAEELAKDQMLAAGVDLGPVARLFPMLAKSASGKSTSDIDDSEVRRLAILAVRELLQRLGRSRTVLLLIDDFQWSDVDSRAVLAEILRPPSASVACLLLDRRVDEESGELERDPWLSNVQELRIEPLTQTAAQELARVWLPQDWNEPRQHEAAVWVARESGGHPLFVQELGLLVAQGGRDTHERTGVITESAEPQRLDQTLARRLDGLSPASRELLEFMSVAAGACHPSDLCAAAGLPANRHLAAQLRRSYLAKVADQGREERIEPYHDRVRETVLAQLAPDRLREVHRRLAATLEESGRGPAEVLAIHFQHANLPAKGAFYAEEAAQQAASRHAFEMAARWYRTALELGEKSEPERRTLRYRLADALAGAGRSLEAAREYEHCLDGAQPEELNPLSRRVGEMLLHSGRTKEGIELLDRMLKFSGASLPRGPVGGLWEVVRTKLRILCRGYSYSLRDVAPSTPALNQVDILHIVGGVLAYFDIQRGAGIMARALRESLDLGESTRVLATLAQEMALLALQGKEAEANRLVAQCNPLSQGITDPRSQGYYEACQGIVVHWKGRWRQASMHLDSASRMLRRVRTGAYIEVSNCLFYSLWALYYLGDLREIARRVNEAFERSRVTQDLFTRMQATIAHSNIAWLAQGDEDRARTLVQQATAPWKTDAFGVPHALCLIGELQADLYSHRGIDAWRRISLAWPKLRRCGYMSLKIPGIEMLDLRARAALAAQRQGRGPSISVVEELAAAMAREGIHWVRGMSCCLLAAIAANRGHTEVAKEKLRTAIAIFEHHEMPMHAAVARLRLGQATRGHDGTQHTERSLAWMQSQGVVEVERFASMLLPW